MRSASSAPGHSGAGGTAAAGLPAAYLATGSSSFTEFVASVAPELLPGRRPLPAGAVLEAQFVGATAALAR